jgi:hypothetical protein
VPGRAFIQHVDGLHAEESLDFLLAGFVFQVLPPFFQPRDDGIAIKRDFITGGEGAVFGRDVGKLHCVLNAAFDRLQVRFADAEHMMTHQADRTVTIVDNEFIQFVSGHLAHETLCSTQHQYPLADQIFRRQRFVAGALQADKFGNIFKILAKDELLSPGNDGYIAHAVREQAFAALRIIQYVDGDEINFFARKKLFRPETATSSRLRKKYELFSGGVHVRPFCRELAGNQCPKVAVDCVK